ncbi:hypothetical protein jhhlp_006526 [Lomentospora prolificans]|uniref:Pre-mRNA splicing factor CLF1 n=1 Tax=Lomentospora prolificans TaxID=41688 RepID=A0A2N3N679_9PEZI|nr:hypothetical protein jhhlp_006526 [Lomentospora prolificans]
MSSVPEPPVALDNVCGVIYDNSLYIYSPSAFLRLDLEPGAEWEQLASGVSVKGGVCVGASPGDASRDGLYIVGGVGPDDSYNGLQKFTYSTGKWETISPVTTDIKNRRWHGATYLKSSDSILVYAGTQNDAEAISSQTFTIGAQAPYDVTSFDSNAPTVLSPLVLPWSDSEAVMVGGGIENRRVMLFNKESNGWRDSHATMADPIPKGSAEIKGLVITGDDGSKSLYTFDMTQAPNLVRRIALLDGSGAPITNSPTVVARSLDVRQSSRDTSLTYDRWPSYNDTLVPGDIRVNYAAATDASGTVYFAGGNSDHTLCIFDARENAWVNAAEVFTDQKVLGAASSSTSSAIARATSTTTSASLSSTAAVAATATPESSNEDDAYPISSNTILGIVLGSILGIMVILGLLLFLIRRRKNKGRTQPSANNDESPNIEKGDLDFGAELAAAGKKGYFRGHQAQNSAGSYSSMAILMGKVNQQNKNLGRKPSNGTIRSSISSIYNKEFKSTISKPVLQDSQLYPPQIRASPEPGDRVTVFGPSLTPKAAPPRPPRGDSTLMNDSLEPARRSSGWNRYWSGGSALGILGFGNGKRATVDSDQSSRYSDNKNRITQDSATVPPLHIEGRAELNRVNTGSPTVAHYPPRIPMREGMSGKIERPVSDASSGYSSGVPDSVPSIWDPMAKKPWGADRARSSAYGNASQGRYQSSLDPSSTANRDVSQQPQLAMANTSSDMSWLNLGEYRRG